MKKHLGFLIFLLSLIAAPSLSAQSCQYQLYGTAVDIVNKDPLIGAIITIEGKDLIEFTDFDGNFTIDGLCKNLYRIKISHPLCKDSWFDVVINDDVKIQFEVTNKVQNLEEVMVSEKLYGHDNNTTIETTIDSKTIDRNSSETFGDMLNNLTGVTSLNTGNAIVKPVVNGLHSSRVAIINNGVKMEDQEWGSEHAPNVDLNTASYVSLIKGANAIQYGGDAIGGVIIAEPEKIFLKDSIYGKSMITGMSNGYGVSTNSSMVYSTKTGLQAKAQASYKMQGDVHTPDYIMSNSGNNRRAASFSLAKKMYDKGIYTYYSYMKSNIGIIEASHIGGAEDLLRAINSKEPLVIEPFTYSIEAPKQRVTHRLFLINGYKNLPKWGKLSLKYDWQNNRRIEFDIRKGNLAGSPSLDLDLLSQSLSLDLDSYKNKNESYKMGVRGKYQYNFANPETKVRRLIPDYEKYDFGVYGVYKKEFSDSFGAELGLRFDYTSLNAYKFYKHSLWQDRNYELRHADIVVDHSENQVLTNPQLDYLNSTATLGFHKHLFRHSSLLFNFTTSSRAPNPAELFSEGLHHSASRIEIGNLDFIPEKSNKLSLSFEHEDHGLYVSAQPFINLLNDFIVIEPVGIEQTIRGNFQLWEYRQTNATLSGFDVDFEYEVEDHWKYNSQIAYVRGYDRTKQDFLISMPPFQFKNKIQYELKSKLYFGLENIYVARQNNYPNTNYSIYLPQSGDYKTLDISTPPEAHNLLNLDAEIPLHQNKHSNATLNIKVTNLLNARYRNYLNSMRFFTDEMGRNLIVQYTIHY